MWSVPRRRTPRATTSRSWSERLHLPGLLHRPEERGFPRSQLRPGLHPPLRQRAAAIPDLRVLRKCPGRRLSAGGVCCARALGGTVTSRTNHWPDIFGSTGMQFGNGVWAGLWYEQSQERLWTTWAIDYPDDTQMYWTKTFVVRTLNSDGTVSNVQGPWGLQGIGNRRIYGGVRGHSLVVPELLQRARVWRRLGRLLQPNGAGSGAALGPTFYTFPEPTGLRGWGYPTTAYKTLMTMATGSTERTGTPTACRHPSIGASAMRT